MFCKKKPPPRSTWEDKGINGSLVPFRLANLPRNQLISIDICGEYTRTDKKPPTYFGAYVFGKFWIREVSDRVSVT
jgi:hypothetical protein